MGNDGFSAICLCGLLPGMRVRDIPFIQSCLSALSDAGFPCMELDFRDSTGDMERLIEGLQAAAAGMSIGARVRTRAQAGAALGAGAGWVSLPLAECAALDVRTGQRLIGEIQMNGECDFLQAMPDDSTHIPLICRGAEIWEGTPGSGKVFAVRAEWEKSDGEPKEWAAALERRWAKSLGFILAHIGINGEGEADAAKTAKGFARLLGLPYCAGEASDFAGTLVEVMKENGRGARGHIGFGVNDLERGMYYARRKGFVFDPASRKNNASGQPILYYLEQEIGGFAVHLLQMERTGL